MLKEVGLLSLALFSYALEEVFRKVESELKVLNIRGKRKRNLRFADDVVLFASSEEELRGTIEYLSYCGEEAALTINKENKYTLKISGRRINGNIKWKTNRHSRTNNAHKTSNSNGKTNGIGAWFMNSKNLWQSTGH